MYGKVKMIGSEANRFESISDFKWCMTCGGEVQFRWRGKNYGIVRYGIGKKITAYEAYNADSQIAYDSIDDALEFMAGEERLRDIITQVEVLFRSV